MNQVLAQKPEDIRNNMDRINKQADIPNELKISLCYQILRDDVCQWSVKNLEGALFVPAFTHIIVSIGSNKTRIPRSANETSDMLHPRYGLFINKHT